MADATSVNIPGIVGVNSEKKCKFCALKSVNFGRRVGNRHCPRSFFITEESYISFFRKKIRSCTECFNAQSFDQYSDLFPHGPVGS